MKDRASRGFSYQLYSSRSFGAPADTITMLGALGYAQAEAYGGIYDQAVAMRAALERAGMTMPSGHFDLAMVERAPQDCIRLARQLGMTMVICPWLAAAERPTSADGWRAFGARLQAASAPIRAVGLRFAWHNHDFEFRPLPDGSFPFDHMLGAAPDVGWQIDLAWVIAGGQDPEIWIRKYAGRILSCHMKDMAPEGTNVEQDGWTGIGQGTIEWAALLPVLRAAGCGHFVLEHDNPADDRDFATVSIAAVEAY